MGDSEPTIDAQLLASQAGWLRNLALRLVRDEGRAEELAQETLGKAWISQPRGAGDEPVLRAWLTQALRNLVRGGTRDAARRRQRELRAARPERNADGESTLEMAENARVVLEAVMGLPEPYRSTVLLRYYEGHSVVQIAQRAGAQPPAVRKRLSRAHDLLRERIGQSHPGGESGWRAVVLAWALPSPSSPVQSAVLGGILMNARFKALVVAVLMMCGAAWLVWRSAETEPIAEPVAFSEGAPYADQKPPIEVAQLDPPSEPRVSVQKAEPDPSPGSMGVRVHGRVSSQAGEVLEDVSVSASWSVAGSDIAIRAQPDETGHYDLLLPYPGGVSIHTLPNCRPQVLGKARGHLSEWHTAGQVDNLDGGYRLDIVLDSGPVVEGWVRTPAGEPVASAEVLLCSRDGDILEMGWTSFDGHYTLALSATGTILVTANSARYGVGASSEVAAVASEDVHIEDIVCEVHGTIGGQVVLPSGAPIKGIRVRAYPAGDHSPDAEYTSMGRHFRLVDGRLQTATYLSGLECGFASSNADGEFWITGLAPGAYVLTTIAHGAKQELAPVGPVATGTEVRIPVKAHVLRVRVHDDQGMRFPNADLRLTSASAEITGGDFDRTGTHETFLSVEPWTVEVQVPGAPAVIETVDVLPSVYEYEVVVKPDFALPHGQVAVRARDRDGRPLVMDELELAPLAGLAGPTPADTVLHGAGPLDGESELRLPAGRYAFKADFGTLTTGLHAPETGQFLVREGELTTLNLKPEPWSRIALTLEADGGDPSELRKGLEIEIQRFGQSDPERLQMFTRMTAEGRPVMRFLPSLDGEEDVLRLLKPGPYTLRIRGPGVHPIERDLQLEAGEWTRLRLNVLTADD